MAALQVGVLALQGAFREHISIFRTLGASVRELRQKKDLSGLDAVVLPGGESTTMGKLLVELDMLPTLRASIAGGLPAFGTCAGLILLCREIENSSQPRIGLLNACVRRNAFGRQAESFECDLDVTVLDPPAFPAVFIRAPVLASVGEDTEVLACVNGQPVAVRQDRMLGLSFHPELTGDVRIHRYFLSMCTHH